MPHTSADLRDPTSALVPAHEVLDDDALREHLVATRLAGPVATSPRNTIENCGKLVRGRHDYRFGLPDWRDASLLDALAAVRAVCGGDPGGATDLDGPGWIDPDATLRAVDVHAGYLAEVAGSGGARVLIATGHPTGLLGHYAAIARHLVRAGCALLTPLDDEWLSTEDGAMGLRFVEGVGCAFDGASLRHTHLATFMEAMLASLGGERVDLVVADHGMAGAAIHAGIRTLSIADVNDPGLPLAQVRGRTDAVLPIDDNLAPRVFTPVTARMLGGPPRS